MHLKDSDINEKLINNPINIPSNAIKMRLLMTTAEFIVLRTKYITDMAICTPYAKSAIRLCKYPLM